MDFSRQEPHVQAIAPLPSSAFATFSLEKHDGRRRSIRESRDEIVRNAGEASTQISDIRLEARRRRVKPHRILPNAAALMTIARSSSIVLESVGIWSDATTVSVAVPPPRLVPDPVKRLPVLF
ncbi:MAG: hypothetical protein QOC81_4788 [Thermoanaerobaculia bacterium]|nr:hypothetical protein [Thermoanaerobaculia bacterium]